SSSGGSAATVGLTSIGAPVACRFLACSNCRRYSSSHSSLSSSGTKPLLSQKKRVVASIASSRTDFRSMGGPLLVDPRWQRYHDRAPESHGRPWLTPSAFPCRQGKTPL